MLVRYSLRKNITSIPNTTKLSNFLKQTNKDTTSNVYRGTLFELQTLESLSSMTGMSLDHCGGKGDGGIDLRGQWFNQINVLVQCKNTKQGCTPDHIRELMGTVLSTTTKKKKVLGILSTVSHKQFTRDVLSLFNASPVPLGLAMVEETTLKSLMFNKKAQSILKGLTITTQYDAQGNETLFVEMSAK